MAELSHGVRASTDQVVGSDEGAILMDNADSSLNLRTISSHRRAIWALPQLGAKRALHHWTSAFYAGV